MTKTVFISAGEVSGDKHGFYLCQEILKIDPKISFYGFGSNKMKDLGINLLSDLTLYSGIGLVENIPAAYHASFNYKIAKKFFKENNVSLVILIDNQGFNIRLASLAKKINIPVVYYIGPQEWIWGFKNGIHRVMKNIDTLYTIFKAEYEFYHQYKNKIKYFGHPLLNIIATSKDETSSNNLFNNKKYIIGLMPGSRKQEFNNTIPVFLEIYEKLKDNYNFFFIIPEIWKKFVQDNFNLKDILIIYGNSEKYMKYCDLIIASSGTVTLEAVILDIPIIPCYKLNKISYLIAKTLIKPDFVTLPNIVAKKKVINEFLQNDMCSENIINEIDRLINDKKYLNNIKSEFKNIRKNLEPYNSIENTARDIVSTYLKG
ncbi:MAG: lipid-A-disaccharide synthase [Candidatus Sericytochromatia bacterium]